MTLKTSPLNERQLKALSALTEDILSEQAVWLSGYFQGLLSSVGPAFLNNKNDLLTETAAMGANLSLTILYGTHTGRCKSIADDLFEKASLMGIEPKVIPMDEYKPKKLASEENLAIIVSTHGEGEPPAMSEDFFEAVTAKRAPKLQQVNFAVLALGDRSYKLFCKTGIDIDQAFLKNGANQLLPVVTCDVDYEDDAEQWIGQVLGKLDEKRPKGNISQSVEGPVQKVHYSRKNPFYARVLEKVKITGRESDKEVYHVELSLENSGIEYEPGDALGILTDNPPSLVDAIMNQLKLDPQERITLKSGEFSVKEALSHHLEITVLTRDVLRKYQEKRKDKKLKAILENDAILEDYLYGNDALDLIEQFPADIEAGDLPGLFRSLPPRLYSISSSQLSVEDEVHITVSVVRYEHKGRKRAGACSSLIADRLELDDKVPVYIEKNPAFRLPEQDERAVIMVGAGTGVAPYRAFLQHREAREQKGKTWLVFGERTFRHDFLYQLEWQKHLRDGYLEKLDVAFSRDQKDKVYVQHRLIERQKEIYEWLRNGAVFYLCGDMKYMAKDVQKTLLSIFETEGGMSTEKAEEFFRQLKREKRYQTDVY